MQYYELRSINLLDLMLALRLGEASELLKVLLENYELAIYTYRLNMRELSDAIESVEEEFEKLSALDRYLASKHGRVSEILNTLAKLKVERIRLREKFIDRISRLRALIAIAKFELAKRALKS